MSDATPHGHLVVISAPSGTGKTTVIDHLLARNPKLVRAITCTTRLPRGEERDGSDYFFLSNSDFDAKIQANEFLEWATVHGNRYGTLRKTCMDLLDLGKNIVLNIDVQGAINIKSIFPKAVLIFLSPPSLEILEERLKARGTDSPEVIAERVKNAKFEIQMKTRYDYEVVNDDLEKAVEDLDQLISTLQ